MLPLTPVLFKRNELEQLSFANLLNSVWAKNNEVYMLPHSVGMNGSMLVYNETLLKNANVDPKGLTSLDGIVAAGNQAGHPGGRGRHPRRTTAHREH